MDNEIKYEDIKKNEEINTYIKQADMTLNAMGYTEHSFVHASKVAKVTKIILSKLGFSKKSIVLGQIAGYMHDIGNVINRADHAQTGAIMAFTLLNKLNMPDSDIASIITAIGHHDETTAYPANAVTAAMIIADKTDVRRTRVRNTDVPNFDIHDRVNYAVVKSMVEIRGEENHIYLILDIDTKICPVMDYFEIFLNRMILCRKAAKYLNTEFKLIINDLEMM